MPRKRPKTAADRPVYRPAAPQPVPEAIEPFLAVLELLRLVKKYGVTDVQAGLNIIAEHERRMMIERRSSEMLDAWKENVRPLAPIRIPHLSVLRSARGGRSLHGYRGHREEHLDKVIREQTRIRELEDGLAAFMETGVHPRKQEELVQIVDRAKLGETAAQIAKALDVSLRTVEGRLAELREAAVAAEEKKLAPV